MGQIYYFVYESNRFTELGFLDRGALPQLKPSDREVLQSLGYSQNKYICVCGNASFWRFTGFATFLCLNTNGNKLKKPMYIFLNIFIHSDVFYLFIFHHLFP